MSQCALSHYAIYAVCHIPSATLSMAYAQRATHSVQFQYEVIVQVIVQVISIMLYSGCDICESECSSSCIRSHLLLVLRQLLDPI